MVQIIPIIHYISINSAVFFISHMVQIIHDRELVNEVLKENFISHMVQIIPCTFS